MESLVVVKFGGSAIGVDGISIPVIVQRVEELLKKYSKILCVFSAPLTSENGRAVSITDVVLGLGRRAESGEDVSLKTVADSYGKILELVNTEYRDECEDLITSHLERAARSLEISREKRAFSDEARSNALAFSGELLMSCVMDLILRGQGLRSRSVPFASWPIITDTNIESSNFLYSESSARTGQIEELLATHDIVTIGGFIGKTADGVTTTFERGGSDRTAAALGILLHRRYNTVIDLEKDSSVVSADPKIVSEGLDAVGQLSYNEARQAGMFGMKILDPIAIKEILENGVDIPITISNMHNPASVTVISRKLDSDSGHPLKIVTGKRNCAILRIETDAALRLLVSLEKDRRYSEFVILSPFTKDGIEFTRMLFLDGDYIKRNEKYFLGFDSLAAITYGRGVITLIGDEMWRVQQVVSKTSARLGDAGLNILNMDAQEETSRIVIVIEDSDDDLGRAIRAIHTERAKITYT